MDVYYGKKSRIRTTSLNNQTEYNWYFNPDGSLTLPQDSALKGADSLTVSTNYRAALGPFTGIVSQTLTGNGYIIVSNNSQDLLAGVTLSDLTGGTLTFVSQTNTILGVTLVGNNIYSGQPEYSVHISGPTDSSTGGTGIGISIAKAETKNDWTFRTDGTLTLPTGGGDEGGEIDFTKAPNSTLSGTAVVVDQYQDRLRIFENGGTTRGAYIDLNQAAAGVGTLLNNRVSGFVNAGTFVTMDLLKATVTTSSNRGLSLAATTGFFTIRIAGTYARTSTTGGAMAEVTLTTTPEASMFDWDFSNAGDSSTYIITDITNNRSYRITLQIGYLYNDNMICIERLI
jgi:hypothetical protein